jgi:hypothetical protein
LEALCKQYEEVIEKLKKENTTLEGMVQSRDELIMEIATKTGLNRMGEDDHEDDDEDDNDDEDDDDDDRGDAVAPSPTTAPPAAAPEFVVEEEEDLEEMVLEQEAPEAWEVILLKEEPEPPHPDLFTMLMRDHEEISSRMFDDLDDPTHVDYDMDEWFLKDGSHDHD